MPSKNQLAGRKQEGKKSMGNDKKWVMLNVGGTYFMTSRSTLTKSTPQNSPLHRISSNSTNVEWERDEKGAYMIDRDPIYFQSVLNFLRHGHLLLSRDVPEEAILLEAEHFNLPELIKTTKQRLNNRERWRRIYNDQLLQHPASINLASQSLQLDLQPEDINLTAPTNYLYPQLNYCSMPTAQSQSFQHQLGKVSGLRQLCANQLPHRQRQQQQQQQITSSIASSSNLNSLINQQEYLTSYVNNILEEEPI